MTIISACHEDKLIDRSTLLNVVDPEFIRSSAQGPINNPNQGLVCLYCRQFPAKGGETRLRSSLLVVMIN